MGYFSGSGGGESFFHKDGRGMVDAGHYCVQGFNHVVMFRRLPPDWEKRLKESRLIPFFEEDTCHRVSFWHYFCTPCLTVLNLTCFVALFL